MYVKKSREYEQQTYFFRFSDQWTNRTVIHLRWTFSGPIQCLTSKGIPCFLLTPVREKPRVRTRNFSVDSWRSPHIGFMIISTHIIASSNAMHQFQLCSEYGPWGCNVLRGGRSNSSLWKAESGFDCSSAPGDSHSFAVVVTDCSKSGVSDDDVRLRFLLQQEVDHHLYSTSLSARSSEFVEKLPASSPSNPTVFFQYKGC